jgi:transposase-like protein
MTIVETAALAGAEMSLPLSSGANGQSTRAANATDPSVRAEGLRRLRETRDAQRKIAADLGVSASLVSRWVKQENVERPPGAPKAPAMRAPGRGRAPGTRAKPAVRRRAMVDRLFKAFARQVAAIEPRLCAADVDLLDPDARTLGVLAKTLETLFELDRDGAKVGEPEPRDRGHLRLELARKIAAWAEEEGEPGTAAPPTE